MKEHASSSTRKINMKTHIIDSSIKSLVKAKNYVEELKTSCKYG